MTGLGRMRPAVFFLLLAGCADSPPDLELAPLTPGSATSPSGNGLRSTGSLKSANAPELFNEAKRSAGMGNLGGAASLLEEVVKLEPDNREALSMLASVNQGRAQSLQLAQSVQPLLRSAELMRHLRSKFPELTEPEADLLRTALYNEALVLASQGKSEQALASLKEAVDSGFMSLDHLKNDAELESIRKSDKFQALVSRVEGVAQIQVKNKVKALFAATKPFPFEFRLPDLEGKMVSSSDYRGKVLIVDFWGTWCPPCRREIPLFIELHKAHQADGLEIVGLNYEQVPPEQVKATVAEFVKENKIPYPCLIGDEKTQAGLGEFEGYPTTLFIDRTGKVRAKLVGLFDMDDSLSRLGLEDIVTTLLAEKAPASAETP